MLRLEHITKSYSSILFDDLNFTLGSKEKVGLVGLNGCGKTTLFKIIAGLEEPDSGSVVISHERIAMLPQEFSLPHRLLVGEFLENLVDHPQTEMYRVNIILAQLNLTDLDDYTPLDHLSDGQRMKLYLTQLLMGKDASRQTRNHDHTSKNHHSDHPPLLLLDEPTNHLDIDGILWLERFICKYDGISLFISHDRAFLNAICDQIFEIDEQKLHIYIGNYDDYLDQKAERIELRRQHFVRQEKKRKQLEQLVENSQTIGNGSKRGNAVEAAKKRLYREVVKDEIDLYTQKQIKAFSIAGSVHPSKKMLDVKSIEFAYPQADQQTIRTSSLTLYGGEKFWILGPNGSGKTTFIKLLMGLLTPQKGSITWGNTISYAYFSQNQTHLPMDKKVAEFFMEQTGISFEHSFGALNKFLFDKTQRDAPIGLLSPGQRARLSFAVFAQKDYDFLILDEPTNHLDIETKELIEQALASFSGNIILISHDRYFVKNVGPKRAAEIKKGVLVEVAQ